MDIAYEKLAAEVIAALTEQPVWVLSTALHDHVTSRPMSIVNDGFTVYFQSNSQYEKHEQMQGNPQVALCCQNISLEGRAEDIGGWAAPENAAIQDSYQQRQARAYEAYAALPGQRVYRFTPIKAKLWKYENGKPCREILWVNAQRAERLDIL